MLKIHNQRNKDKESNTHKKRGWLYTIVSFSGFVSVLAVIIQKHTHTHTAHHSIHIDGARIELVLNEFCHKTFRCCRFVDLQVSSQHVVNFPKTVWLLQSKSKHISDIAHSPHHLQCYRFTNPIAISALIKFQTCFYGLKVVKNSLIRQ